MKTIKGNLWEQKDADAICVTTNGFCRKDGACVMGRGCALEAKNLYPGIEYILGGLIQQKGNHVHAIGRNYKTNENQYILSFPVKSKFWEKASLPLIDRSARELVQVCDRAGFKKVVIPRPGCGCGKLHWEMVKIILEKVLDDRFYVITY